MIRLNQEMRDAIAAAVDAAGSQMEFQRKTGIKQSTINKVLNGKSMSIADRTWRDLLPFVSSFVVGDAASVVGNNSGVINHSSSIDIALNKILDSDELTSDEKIKVIKVLKK